MMPECRGAVVIGAGQGGLSTSYFLKAAGIDHVVLERGGIGDSWKNRRWDSFCLVTPNWTIKLPGWKQGSLDPHGFVGRDEFVRLLEAWAADFNAPVRCGVEVRNLRSSSTGRSRFVLDTTSGDIEADAVVVATGTYQKPKVPAAAEKFPEGILQLHAESYKNPDQAAAGAVLLIGSGQTGCQIAEDFLRAGRQVYLSVGRSGRLPRRYRGKDCLEWQAEMGTLDRTPDMLDGPTDRFKGDPHVTGRDGGSSVSLYGLHRRGALLLGRLVSAYGDALSFDGSLASNIAYADRFASDLSASVDAHIDATAQSAPAAEQDPANADWPPDVPVPDIRTLSLKNAGIGSVIWATGFDYDFSWIEFPVLDEWGYPVAQNGATRVPGLFFCGLNWMTWRKSGILYGVAEDALAVSERIASALGKDAAPVSVEAA